MWEKVLGPGSFLSDLFQGRELAEYFGAMCKLEGLLLVILVTTATARPWRPGCAQFTRSNTPVCRKTLN
jgi:hypothetical protein